MTAHEIRKLLKIEIESAGSITVWSRRHGVSLPYASSVLAGRSDPGEKVLTALGYRKVVSYEPIGSAEMAES